MLISDLHIHTLMSGHAFCTINECIEEAKRKKLALIGITDHGPAMEHSVHEGYFEMSDRIPKMIDGLNILFGCEMNVLDEKGSVDLSADTMEKLDLVLAGLHARTPYSNGGEAKNTNAIIHAIEKNHWINIITHPFRAGFPTSVKDIVSVAKEHNVILELNLSVLLQAMKSDKRDFITVDKAAEMVSEIHHADGRYIINSDAHYSGEIGICDNDYNILHHELGIDTNYLINNDLKSLRQFIPSVRSNL